MSLGESLGTPSQFSSLLELERGIRRSGARETSMGKRPGNQRRPEDHKRALIAPWPDDKPPIQDVANRVSYVGSAEHKTYPSPAGQPGWRPKSDKVRCDRFAETDWPRLVEALRDAIRASCVTGGEFRGDFPARAWAFINGVLHEARLTNQMTGEYHGFPISYQIQFPKDPHDLLRNAPRVEIPVH